MEFKQQAGVGYSSYAGRNCGFTAFSRSCQRGEAICHIPHQQALLKVFRAKKLPVIYVNVNNPVSPADKYPVYGTMCEFMRKQAEMRRMGDDNLKRVDVIPELAPLPGEPVLFNWFLGAFTHSGLEETLKACGINTIVFFGMALHVAVFNATVQAVDLSYSVIVPQDACVPTLSANRHPGNDEYP